VKHTLLFDEVMQYNKWVSGIASRDLSTQRVSLNDIFDTNKNPQIPGAVKAGNDLPYPLRNVINQLGDLYVNSSNSVELFKQALNNPNIKFNDDAKTYIISAIKKLTVIQNIIKTLISGNK